MEDRHLHSFLEIEREAERGNVHHKATEQLSSLTPESPVAHLFWKNNRIKQQ